MTITAFTTPLLPYHNRHRRYNQVSYISKPLGQAVHRDAFFSQRKHSLEQWPQVLLTYEIKKFFSPVHSSFLRHFLDLSGPLHFTDIMLRMVQYVVSRGGQSNMEDSLPGKQFSVPVTLLIPDLIRAKLFSSRVWLFYFHPYFDHSD